jgi:hypothetical protein
LPSALKPVRRQPNIILNSLHYTHMPFAAALFTLISKIYFHRGAATELAKSAFSGCQTDYSALLWALALSLFARSRYDID